MGSTLLQHYFTAQIFFQEEYFLGCLQPDRLRVVKFEDGVHGISGSWEGSPGRVVSLVSFFSSGLCVVRVPVNTRLLLILAGTSFLHHLAFVLAFLLSALIPWTIST